ncbi:MAG TPA: M1 family metallopeptidase [Solirubrobacterales bacterium]|nr:M1 family metallopeptidase [Solirubrobacterales bacterium]
MRTPRILAVALAALASLAAVPAQAAEAPAEPFFPRAGNRGYDALHYNAVISYRAGGRIHVAERARLQATQRLRRFSLDLYGLRVNSVFVDGKEARFSRGRGKLKVRAPLPIAAGKSFLVKLRYGGRPRLITDPDGSREGWFRSDDGALAVGEPLGTATWLACNDVPRDKATFGISIGVPRPLVAIANGRLYVVESEHERRRFHWREKQPMSTYLAVVDIGRGRLRRSTIAGIPTWTLVDPRLAERVRKPLGRLPEIIRFMSRVFGEYPFDAAGSIVDEVPAVGYALETQTRPIYPYATDLTTVVHETAHQWFGDSVGLKRWPNIWLNEGFATWSEWYYAERHGGRSAHAIFNRLYRVPASNQDFWEPPSGHPGSPKNLFATSTYVRGAMALEALRLQIGTQPMLRLLRTWVAGHRYGSGDIEEFIALAEKISGRQLDRLFQRWLYRRGKP